MLVRVAIQERVGVWVASVRDGTDLFRLTWYKLNGSELVEKNHLQGAQTASEG